MPNPNKTDIVTVLGISGMGKSSWIERKLPSWPRFILWDTLGEYSGFDDVDTERDLWDYVFERESGIFRVIMQNAEETKEGELRAFEFTCRVALAVENVCLIVDEVDTYADSNHIPGALQYVLKKGRHAGVSMVFASRRPAEVNRLITAQSRHFVLFHIAEPKDLAYLRSRIGEAVDLLPGLPPLHYIEWRDGQVSRGEISWNDKNGLDNEIVV